MVVVVSALYGECQSLGNLEEQCQVGVDVIAVRVAVVLQCPAIRVVNGYDIVGVVVINTSLRIAQLHGR